MLNERSSPPRAADLTAFSAVQHSAFTLQHSIRGGTNGGSGEGSGGGEPERRDLRSAVLQTAGHRGEKTCRPQETCGPQDGRMGSSLLLSDCDLGDRSGNGSGNRGRHLWPIRMMRASRSASLSTLKAMRTF